MEGQYVLLTPLVLQVNEWNPVPPLLCLGCHCGAESWCSLVDLHQEGTLIGPGMVSHRGCPHKLGSLILHFLYSLSLYVYFSLLPALSFFLLSLPSPPSSFFHELGTFGQYWPIWDHCAKQQGLAHPPLRPTSGSRREQPEPGLLPG